MADEVETLDLIGVLPPSWKVARFGDVLEGGTRNGIYKAKDFHGRGAKIVNMGELFAHPRLRDVPMKRVELSDSEMEKSCLKKDDLLFARRSLVAEGAGKCIVVAEVKEPTTFESSIIRARPNPQVVDSLFLYYLFNSPYGAYVLQTIRRQVAVSGITGTDLVELPVPLPPLAEQKAIAAVLGALDDKIELNRRMNATLDAMARALFQSWFVDFDPVRAKMDGQEPVGMDQSTADLFPGSFQDSEVGHIPKGWTVRALSNHACCLNRGFGPSYLEQGGVCVLNQKCVREHRVDYSKSRRHDPVKKPINGRGLQIYDVLVNSTGTGTLGRVAQVFHVPEETIVDSHVTVIRAAADTDALFLGINLTSREAEIEELGEGSTGQTELSRPRLGELTIIAPPLDLQKAFGATVRPLLMRISENESQSRSLATVRDTLLPKLLSGELRVRETSSWQ